MSVCMYADSTLINWQINYLYWLVCTCRLILENLLKYGWRLNFISYVSRSLSGSGNLPLVLAFPALVLFCVVALCTEKLGVYCLKVEEQVISTHVCPNPTSAEAAVVMCVARLVGCTHA